MQNRVIRPAVAVLVVSLLAFAALAANPVDKAEAATSSFSSNKITISDVRSASGSKYLASIKACIKYSVTAKITATFTIFPALYNPTEGYFVQNPKTVVSEPRLTVYATTTCSSTTPVSMSRVTELMVVMHKECKPSGLSVSVGVPWSVGASATYSCSSTKSASNSQTIATSSSTFNFYNTGRAVTLDFGGSMPQNSSNIIGGWPYDSSASACARIGINLTVVRGSTSDNPLLPELSLCATRSMPW